MVFGFWCYKDAAPDGACLLSKTGYSANRNCRRADLKICAEVAAHGGLACDPAIPARAGRFGRVREACFGSRTIPRRTALFSFEKFQRDFIIQPGVAKLRRDIIQPISKP